VNIGSKKLIYGKQRGESAVEHQKVIHRRNTIKHLWKTKKAATEGGRLHQEEGREMSGALPIIHFGKKAKHFID